MLLFFSFIIGAVNVYTALFLIAHLPVIAGILLSFRKERVVSAKKITDTPVSVIIPARDEEETLPALFDSLLSQGSGNFEIILVNDRSSDATLEVMESFRRKYPEKVKVIDNREEYKGKNPKQMALSLAESIAAGEIFLYTDADCSVPPGWVEYMTKPFADPGVGLVFGTVSVDGGKGFLEKFQQFDHLLRYHYTAASAGLGLPTGGFGNNLAVRRGALEEIGGFGNLEYTVTEDAQLIARIRDTGRWKIFAQTSWKSMVYTAPVKTWRELYIQELRWSTGAIHAPDIASRIGYGFIMYQLLCGIILFLPAFQNPSFFPVFFAGIICMLAVSVVSGLHLRVSSGYWATLVPCILIAQFLFPVVTARATFKPSIIWKGSRLDL